jgi:hypothetical protein
MPENLDALRNSAVGALAFNIRCDADTVKDLTPEQLAALHVFGHKVLASGYRLYEVIPKEKADPLIRKALERVLKDMDNQPKS